MPAHSLVLLAHNIRSLWNVGSLFRTADCFGVEKIYLSGYTGTPPRREISKTAIGAEEWIPWEYSKDPLDIITSLKNAGYAIAALEQGDQSIDCRKYSPPNRCCIILGNEVLGVPEELLRVADVRMHIPMHGKKESLNVSVAAGIAIHTLQSLPTALS
jgi:23S rRNA (guanosine2251-2'-O)-methyltransferase